MGDAARELSDGVHLLCLAELVLGLAQRLLRALALGEVDRQAAKLGGLPRAAGQDVHDVA